MPPGETLRRLGAIGSALAARTKKYAPPRYAEASSMEVKSGTIRHAKSRAVSSADGQK